MYFKAIHTLRMSKKNLEIGYSFISITFERGYSAILKYHMEIHMEDSVRSMSDQEGVAGYIRYDTYVMVVFCFFL